MATDNQGRFSTLEWILIISVLLLVQFVIQSLAFVYSGYGNALSYWSLVGTSVSIILAVLAIIWSFIQNLVQQKGSESISAQIERLKEVVRETGNSGAIFESKLTRLEDVESKLQEVIQMGRESKDVVIKTGKCAEESQKILKELAGGSRPEASSPHIVKNTIDKDRFFWSSSLSGITIIYACYVAHRRKTGFDLGKLCKVLQYMDAQYMYGYIVSSCASGILECVENNGVWTVSNIVYGEDYGLRDKICEKIKKSTFQSSQVTLTEHFQGNLDLVDKFFSQGK